uniref:PLA2c domain-containing protein n=1 Tax=Tetraodon nigroviridis TaxID=99883 RepID=H3D922_TETNG
LANSNSGTFLHCFQISIHYSTSICDGEQKYISSRKKMILKTIQELGIDCIEDSVPHVALLGSGGGERATVAMLGSTDQLVKERLFDTLLYTGGVSGSTWAMASLYSDPHFEVHMNQIISKMLGPDIPLSQILAWLDDRTDDDTFSLTDIWAVLTTAEIMKQLELRKLSEEAERNATNPYPIYTAVAREFTSEDPSSGTVRHWFEVSPHESGYTELDLFVDTPQLGSKFAAGCLQEKLPEMDMVKLQGICGSALADLMTIIRSLLNFLGILTHPQCPQLIQLFLRFHNMTTVVLRCVYEVFKYIIKPAVKKKVCRLSITEWVKTHYIFVKEAIVIPSPTSREKASHALDHLLDKYPDTSSMPTTHTTLLEVSWNMTTVVLRCVYELLKHLVKALLKWEWGNTRNFLYNYQDFQTPPQLHSKDIVYLIDAGLWMNLPFPPFLGHKRAVDLIIALDFSAGKAFETLTLAKKYAQDRANAFPQIDDKVLEERDWPRDCYVFEGKAKEPTIVYMPLFNRANCKDEKEVQKMMDKFGTFQLPYSNDKLKKLLNIARDNIKRNKSILHREIKKAASRKRQLSSE